jgi:DNA-binding XRE family transcriptional regulator
MPDPLRPSCYGDAEEFDATDTVCIACTYLPACQVTVRRNRREQNKHIVYWASNRDLSVMLKLMRMEARLTKEQLATLLGVTESLINHIEPDEQRYDPSFELVSKWAHACGTNLVVRFW